MKSLLELYQSHTGKVSDTWALYLREYDRLFAPYREQAISLLEIGIQNGGSLEIWSQYFPNASTLIGCDINPDCGNLSFDDPRIAVVVGDATKPEVMANVLAQSAQFDLIIEDGSHISSDIVKAFALYFPALKSGGLFVAEDLHCSYWSEYEGGIYHPYSSMSFFKYIADMINHEHWGVRKKRTELIAGFKELSNFELSESLLGEISSVEFVNSVCVVRKKQADKNLLGLRIVAGKKAEVMPVILDLANTFSKAIPQHSNEWSSLEKSPTELFPQLHTDLQAKQAEAEQLRTDVQARQAEAEQLRRDISSRQASIDHLNHLVTAMQNSRSWRYTSALRKLGSLGRPLARFNRKVKEKAGHSGGFTLLAIKALKITRREGLKGVLARLSDAKNTAPVITPTGHAVDRNDYQEWIRRYDTLDPQAVERIKAEITAFKTLPKISVVMPVYNAPLHFLKEAIESVQAQIYPNWELCIADDASTDNKIKPLLEAFAKSDKRIKVVYRAENGHISAASNSALELASGEFVALLDNDDLLPQHALYHVAKAIIANPEAALIYSDEDKITVTGERYDPYFKCELNYELLLAQNMVCHLGVYRRDILDRISGFRVGFEGAQDYDLVWRFLENIKTDQVVHLPKILYHWRAIPGSTALDSGEKNYAADAARKAISEHLGRTSRSGVVMPAPDAPSLNRVRYALPEQLPSVSIIIPTRDRADLLSMCLDSLLSKTTYSNFEVIIVDNGSVEESTKHLLARLPQPRVRVIRDDAPFNYSRLNNLAVQQSKGDVICLMNNDIEILTLDWLEEMLSFAMQPDIGCVGARLWYPDGRLQHGGVILGIGGVAGHSHKYLKKGQHGYFGRATLHQSLSSVTAACLMIRRNVWDEVGGLDETFTIAFNDIDFCLRARDLGYRNVWTPYAEMNHHESASRGAEDNPEKLARFNGEVLRMKERWGSSLLKDPAYSPNLTLNFEDFSLAWPPR